MTVDRRKLLIAAEHLQNTAAIAQAAEEVGLDFAVACALVEQESGGRNIYGRDSGGALSGFPGKVTAGNYAVFKWLVFDQGHQSNGVSLCQITHRDLLAQMEREGLKPYRPLDSCRFGFGLLHGYYKGSHDWAKAGALYNGSATYGRDLAKKIDAWRDRLND